MSTSEEAKPLLVDRKEAAVLLNCSYSTVRNMQSDGSLTPIRLRDGATSRTYYSQDQVIALAKHGIKKKAAP